MKITRKMEKLSKGLKMPGEGENGEMAPSLFIHELPSEIEGMPEKGDFQAHIKGKVRRHSVTTENGKSHHSYDLDVHHLEPHGGEKKQKKSSREEVEEAFKKHGPKDEEEAEEKEKKKEK
jgi:hypothetical protein